MKLNKTKFILMCIILMLLNIMIFSTNIEAASFSVSVSKSSVTVGETFNIVVNGTGLIGQYSITSSSNIDAGENLIWIENTSATVTCTAKGEGNATITVTPTTVADTTGQDLNIGPQSVSVSVNTSTTDNTGGTTPPSTSTKSSEARLKNLGFNPEDFEGFRRDTTEYNLEVSNSTSRITVYAYPVDSNATVTGTGTVNLKEGSNTVKVTVTAEDGVTKKTYTMNITRLTAEEDNPENETEARLKNLGIRPTEYDFSGFKRDNTSYTVEVPNELTEVEVYAEAVNPDAKITGTGKVTLQEGENTVNVEVTAPDGTTKKTYTLVITRIASTATEEPEEPTDDEEKVFGLSQLLVKGQNLSPKFSEDVYEYTIGLTEDLSSLDIEALASDENATIEIAGNENLQNGENIITILVSNAETGENATYQIIVNKNVQDEAVVGKVEWLKPSTWGLREKIIVGVIIVLVIIIIVAIVIKVRLSRRDDDDMDLPGGEELDRALSEHQEIEDEVSEAEKDISETEENVKSDAEIAQEYFESYSKRRGKHF